MKKLLFLFLLIVPAISVAAPDPALDPAIQRIVDAAQWEISAKRVPSVAIALVDKNGLIWEGAWGFAEADKMEPASRDNGYRAGSVSKGQSNSAAR